MALLPTIPTSFVPHSPGAHEQRFRHDFSGAYALAGYGILGIVVIMAIGVFVYGRILASTQAAKDTEIAQQESNIDTATVEKFVKIRNRLNYGTQLMSKHIALSNFFDVLGTLIPENVRFGGMSVKFDSTLGLVKVDASGIARNFNALATLSSSFGKDDRINDAIFSGININRDGTVSFNMSATLEPSLIAFKSTGSASVEGSSSTTPSGPTPPTP